MFYALYADLSVIKPAIEQATKQPEASSTPGDQPRLPTQIPEHRAFFDVSLVDIANLVLAVSTVGLWIATRKLWQSSETHARHLERSVTAIERQTDIAERSLVSLNRPYLLFHIPNQRPFTVSKIVPPQVILHPGQDVLPQSTPPQPPDTFSEITYSVGYSFMNHGKTVAIVHGVWTDWHVGEVLPPDIVTYFEDLRVNLNKPRVTTAFIVPEHHACAGGFEAKITGIDKCARITKGQDFFFLYGFIWYSDIFVRKTYVTGQAFKLDPAGFVTLENETYNYDCDEDEMRKRLGLPPREV